MNQLVDQYLLYRIRAKRDPDAFARLYDRYVTAIYRFVYLKLPSKEAAEDVTSEAFLRAWQYIQRAEQIENVRALLYKIARNLIADHYRKQEGKEVSVTFSALETSSVSEGDFDDKEAGRLMIEARADIALILEHISRLKEDFQDVLTLRLIDDLSFSDIGSVLGKTSGNARVMFHRALKALDALMSKETE
jgi:RNA polymerase sigma-70 factor (ECF subfamily)